LDEGPDVELNVRLFVFSIDCRYRNLRQKDAADYM
jgi:hypothetical protein